uniref:Uncharacterized protein n=2 Tax=Oryza TaxID=4527 RepID=Q6Z2X2_ORYSJ|nr:hypothetical protein [Oryza sativa Japonica Group]
MGGVEVLGDDLLRLPSPAALVRATLADRCFFSNSDILLFFFNAGDNPNSSEEPINEGPGLEWGWEGWKGKGEEGGGCRA